VVEAALQLADEHGIEALSMPLLARRLGCGVMTIYGYVAGKDELVTALAQRGLADLRLPAPLPNHPGQVLVAFGRAMRATLLNHPSLPAVFLSRVVIGPGIVRGIEALLSALVRGGVDPASGVRAIYAVLIYTTGFVAWELPRTHREPHQSYAAQWRRTMAEPPIDELPLTASVVNELSQVAGEKQFELGLAALADGLLRNE
jgi:TetR/AcrR family tetracycline transcriptional repressor